MTETAPTVIIARRPRAGFEREFEKWNTEIRDAASRAPGYVGSEAQPPSAAHPNEWLIIYRFDSQPNLDRWLNSAERLVVMQDGQDLIDGPVREQRVAISSVTEAVTAVISQCVKPEDLAGFKAAEAGIASAMSRFPGFVSLEHAAPVQGVQEEYVVSFTFSSRNDLDRWLESPERIEVLGAVEPFIQGSRTLNVIGGLGGWFVADSEKAPRSWKQAVAVLLALYPTTFALSLLQRAFLPESVPWWLALFGSNVLGIAALTWLLMPRLTALLSDWLRR